MILKRWLVIVLVLVTSLGGVNKWLESLTQPPDAGEIVGREMAQLPMRDSNAYQAPTEAEVVALESLVEGLLLGDRNATADSADALGLEIVEGRTSGGRAFTAIREQSGSRRGWGTVLYSDTGQTVAIEIPHPKADRSTELLGTELFDRGEARILLIAGAHRDANDDGTADVAHVPTSFFQSAHTALVRNEWTTMQFHGFSVDLHPGITADAVVSNGTIEPMASSTQLAADLQTASIEACAYRSDGCDQLGGTTNQQASTGGPDGLFIHVELSDALRGTPGWIDAVVDALARP